MNLQFLLFRTKLESELNFDELRSGLVKNIGRRFHKGLVGKDVISLYYLYDDIYPKMGMQRMPTMQLMIERNETKNGKQIIHFKRANYISVLLIAIIVIINIFARLVPIGPEIGVLISIFLHGLLLGRFYQQFEQFKEEIKLITKNREV